MQQIPVTPEQRDPRDSRDHRFPRRAITSSLLAGLILGLIGGAVSGWFAHRLFYQQRAAQVLLCRQQHYGQPEVELQRICGSVF